MLMKVGIAMKRYCTSTTDKLQLMFAGFYLFIELNFCCSSLFRISATSSTQNDTTVFDRL